MINELEPIYNINIQRDVHIFICGNKRIHGKACGSDESMSFFNHFRQAINLNRHHFKHGRIVKVNMSGCLSRCALGPNIVIFPDNIWYNYKTFADIDEIIKEHLIEGRIVNRLLVQTC